MDAACVGERGNKPIVRARVALLGTLFLAAAVGCGVWRPQEPSLDGWPLGAPGTCEPAVTDDPRYDIVAIAERHIVTVHAPVANVACYGEGAYLRDGQPGRLNRSGGVIVVVVTFADGTRRAVGIHCAAACSAVEPPRAPPSG